MHRPTKLSAVISRTRAPSLPRPCARWAATCGEVNRRVWREQGGRAAASEAPRTHHRSTKVKSSASQHGEAGRVPSDPNTGGVSLIGGRRALGARRRTLVVPRSKPRRLPYGGANECPPAMPPRTRGSRSLRRSSATRPLAVHRHIVIIGSPRTGSDSTSSAL